MIEQGHTTLPLTDEEMTRFVITLDKGVELVVDTLSHMYGGEIVIPKLPSIKIVEVIPLLGKDIKYSIIGIRPGEKLHEVMIPEKK